MILPGLDISAEVDADASADSTGLLTDVMAKFHLGVQDLTKELKRANDREQRRLSNIPNYVTLTRNTQTAGTDLLDFGEPQPGRQWSLRLLSAASSTMATNAAVVTWYIGQQVPYPTAGVLPPDFAVWQFSSVPGFKDLSATNITVLPRQHLFAGITGGTGASIFVSARVADMLNYNPLTAVDA